MKLACSTNSFKAYSLEECIQIIADIGYEGVEILCDTPHAYPSQLEDQQINSIKKTISDNNIAISNLNAFSFYAMGDVYYPSWIEDEVKVRERRINYTIDCIKLAKKLGVNTISTEPGGPISHSSSINKLQKDFIDGLMKVIPFAKEENVKILIEPYPGLLIENSQQFLTFMREIHSDYIRLNFDIAHFYCVNEDPSELVHKLSNYTEHFHISDISRNRIHKHLIPGLGSINFESIFRSIRETKYNGYVTVELYPYQDKAQEAVKRAYNYLNNILQTLT
jgi:sugar phosphate isomerase/epimerase